MLLWFNQKLLFLCSSHSFLNASSNTLLFASAVVISSSKLVFAISPSFKSFESFCFFKIGELSQKGSITLFLSQPPTYHGGLKHFFPFLLHNLISSITSIIKVVFKRIVQSTFKSPITVDNNNMYLLDDCFIALIIC